jgi:hypothetical protein
MARPFVVRPTRVCYVDDVSRWTIVTTLLLCTFSGCSRHEERLRQHADALQSLAATTKAIAEAWLDGSVSGTYTRTAFERTYELIEQERTALAKSPQTLIDPRGAALSQAAERLSRIVALEIKSVSDSDARAARQHLTEIPDISKTIPGPQ